MLGIVSRWRIVAAGFALAGSVLLPVPGRAQPACVATGPDAEGPFYQPGAPERERTGRGLVVAGAVRAAPDCAPVPGARLEWWSAGPGGRYDDEHRATQLAGPDGHYRYETDPPPRYGFRPSHLHVRVSAPGHRTLVTQLYPEPGQVSIAFDFVLVRE